jgi:hypothetical protein
MESIGALPLKIFPQARKISRGVILGFGGAVVMCFRCSGAARGCFLPETELSAFFQKIQKEPPGRLLELLGGSAAARLLAKLGFPATFGAGFARCMPKHATRNLAVSVY